jgi:hypothetical protein
MASIEKDTEFVEICPHAIWLSANCGQDINPSELLSRSNRI